MRSFPVLIVGGGPVGLTLALALSRHKVRSMLINDEIEPTIHPTLDAVNTRSMEIFRQLGLVERIREAGSPQTANHYAAIAATAAGPFYSVLSDGHLCYLSAAAGKVAITACIDGTLPLEPMQRIDQKHLDAVLLKAALEDENIEVHYGWSLFGFEQDDAGVTARIHAVTGGASEQVRCDYMVGCDGSNSRVRNFLNIDYQGTRDLLGEQFIIHFRSDEVANLYPSHEPYWHTWICRPGYLGLLVSPDACRNDFVLYRPFPPGNGESVEAIVEAALGVRCKVEIVQSGPWRPQFLIATSFGYGRIFIAGDATHQYMPIGGLGMNTGLAEAHNLAWKLAAAVSGWGGPYLLQSYETERLAVARLNRDHAKKCAAASFEATFCKTDRMLDDSDEGRAAQDAVARDFKAKTSRLYESLGIEIGYSYHSRVLVEEAAADSKNDTPPYRPTTQPGARLPSAFRADGTAVFDQLDPSGFTLLAVGASAEECMPMLAAARNARVPLSVLELGEAYLQLLYEKRFVLVRPDQHVVWRGETIPSACQHIIATVSGAA